MHRHTALRLIVRKDMHVDHLMENAKYARLRLLGAIEQMSLKLPLVYPRESNVTHALRNLEDKRLASALRQKM
jgi:hypothetical protein